MKSWRRSSSLLLLLQFAFFASTILSRETTTTLSSTPLPTSLPFFPPKIAEETVRKNQRAFEVLQILKRADTDTCPNGYNSCSNMGNKNTCCKEGLNCTRDAANSLACCPTGVRCTGTLEGGGGGMTTATGTKTSSSSFRFPSPVSATQTSAGDQGPRVTGSTLSGAAYPFIYVPTTFSNSATCAAYYSACQSEYARCTQALESRYGVTVVGGGGGGGVTVPGTADPAAATSTCSSLSMEACHGLQLGNCDSYGNGGGGSISSTGNGASGSRTSSFQDLLLGLGVAIAGIFV